MNFNARLVVIALCICVSMRAAAQEAVTTCEETLRKADDEFNSGRFYGIPVILNDCLPQFSRDQRFRAYLLLTQTYLLVDDQANAEKSYIEVLKVDPEFVPNEQTESVDIVNLSKKFTSTAIFTPHAKVGAAFNVSRIVQDANLYGNDVERNNIIRPGINFGAGMEWNITQRWGVGAEIFFIWKSDKLEYRNFFEQDITSRISRQFGIDVPLYVRFTDDVGRIRPFGYAGMAFNLLLTSTGQYELIDFTSSGGGDGTAPFQVPNVSPQLNEKYKFRTLTRSILVGGGVKYKLGRDFIMVDLRYMAGMNLMNREEKQLSGPGDDFKLDTEIPGFAFVQPFFRLDNLIFNVGYVRPLYQPRKISRGGILAFLRKGRKNE